MKFGKYKIYGCLLLIVAGAVCLYNAKAEDFSFLKEASGSTTCYTCTEMWKCGDQWFGVGDCAFDVELGGCNPTGCSRYCPEGAMNYYCKNTTPSGGDCDEDIVNCTILTRYQCKPRLFGPPNCDCTNPYTSGYCGRSVC